MVAQARITVEEFEAFVALPENADRHFELIYGEIIEIPPGRTRYSELAHMIAVAVRLFCREHGLSCHTSGEAGTYAIDGHRIAPDFAYKPTPMSEQYPDPEPPLWAVEIISPTDKAAAIRNKRQIYLKAGILLWEVYWQSQSVDIYAPGHEVRVCGLEDMLDAGEVLPGFTLPVSELFGLE